MSEDSEEWTDWIEHDGMGCPCVGKWVERVFSDGETDQGIAGSECLCSGVDPIGKQSAWFWYFGDPFVWYDGTFARPDPNGFIIRYRIRKPRALRQLIEMVESLPEPSKQGERVK